MTDKESEEALAQESDVEDRRRMNGDEVVVKGEKAELQIVDG
jgi:hypothetical protein